MSTRKGTREAIIALRTFIERILKLNRDIHCLYRFIKSIDNIHWKNQGRTERMGSLSHDNFISEKTLK